MRRKGFRLGVLLFILLFLITACGTVTNIRDEKTDSETVKIGFTAPLSGDGAAAGQSMLNGANLAAREINEAGGIDGKQIEIVPEDDKSDPKEAAAISLKFIEDPSIVSVVGGYNSSCSLSALPMFNEQNLPYQTCGTSPIISEQHGPAGFRISITDASQGKFVADWMVEDGHKKIGLLLENNDFGRAMADVVTKEVTAKGGQITAQESYILGQTKDFNAIITKAAASGCTAIDICGTFSEAALIVKQARAQGVDIQFYGADGLYEETFLHSGGEAVEGTKIATSFAVTDTSSRVAGFVAAYKTAYDMNPGVYSAMCYDAVNLFAEAMKSSGVDKVKMIDYLGAMPVPFEGVTGTFTYDENTHDAMRSSMTKLIVEDGSFKTI